ncbi:GUN4 domain-containing protein [Nostoc sp. UIC 10607]|uniref:GUN4 domain-containing protein n=1 Tax=Nostoc sp. UIC 10607 TaxID=3045935 RepID=UPI0039A29385
MDEQNYKLVGYDCPLGSYPSPAVPIVYDSNNKHKAVYLDDNLKVYIDSVVETASFFRLSDCDKNARKKLKKFDYRKHRLYALSKSNVDFYEIEDETYFFVKLLIDSNFCKDNPLTRVSLAEATGIKDLLNRELQNYEQYLQEHKRNWLKFWEQEKNTFREKIQQAEDISKILNKIPTTGEKASEVEVDYTNLRNLLQNKNFLEADKETAILMLQLLQKHKNINIKNFPELDLRTIDKLWVISSNGKFGFSVQKEKIDEIRRLVFLLKSEEVDSLVDDWYFPFLGMVMGIIIGRKTQSLGILLGILKSEVNNWRKGRMGVWSVRVWNVIVQDVLKRNGLEEMEREEGNGGRGGLLVISKEKFSRNEVERYVEIVKRLIEKVEVEGNENERNVEGKYE